MQRGRSPVSVRDLLAAGLLQSGQDLSFRQRPGTTAEVTEEGKLKIGLEEYSSPSAAARAVLGGTSTNGWRAWHVRVDDGLSTLADLRTRLLKG